MSKPPDSSDPPARPPTRTDRPPRAITRPLARYPVHKPEREPPPEVMPAEQELGVERLPFTIDRTDLQRSVKNLASDLAELAKKGRYTKVRIKLGSRQVLPEMPVAVALAAGGLSAVLIGPLEVLLGTMVGQALLTVELVSDAASYVTRGRELILAGELDAALDQFRIALAVNRDHAPAHLNLGVALKLKGDRDGARGAFERASALDPKGPTGLEAEKLLATLRS
jgi:tetratricopeptide (TPR) repeat protein